MSLDLFNQYLLCLIRGSQLPYSFPQIIYTIVDVQLETGLLLCWSFIQIETLQIKKLSLYFTTIVILYIAKEAFHIGALYPYSNHVNAKLNENSVNRNQNFYYMGLSPQCRL